MEQSKPENAKPTERLSLRATMRLMRETLPHDEQGATAIEYAMVAAGISVAIVAAVSKLGSSTASLYQSVAGLFH